MSEYWWCLSDVVRRHNQSTYEKSGLHSSHPCRNRDYICKYCGQRFSTYANCLAHEKSCADWERISLPCNAASEALIGMHVRCSDYCNRQEHCDERFTIYRNRQTGEFAWERP